MKLLLLASFICLSQAYSDTPIQYHIQTDDGNNRYFRYQTYNGQYRKEKRFQDGTVIGSYGWVDANNYLRLYNYIADKNGYRIISFKKRKVEPPRSNFKQELIRPKVQSSQQISDNFGSYTDNSIEDNTESNEYQKQSEFINSKRHPKLEPNYSSNREKEVFDSQEVNSVENMIVSQSRQKSPEFINSKIHPKLRPLYSSNKKSRHDSQDDNSVEESRISQRRQSSPEFINSKIHPKLLQPVNTRNKKRQISEQKQETPSQNNEVSQRSKISPEFINSKIHPKLRPDYTGNDEREIPVAEKDSTTQNSTIFQNGKSTPEFINSKMHPKLRPDYISNDNSTDVNSNSFGVKIRPTTKVQSMNSNGNTQSSSSRYVKSTTVPEGFRLDEPGGKITIDFDLGNQYRREKMYPDGRIIGEHGYVDPFGILRKTFYKSGPGGPQEKRVSYWVGTRNPRS